MSFRATFATARRVLTQLRRDPRTLALLLFVPVALVLLLEQLFSDRRPVREAYSRHLFSLSQIAALPT